MVADAFEKVGKDGTITVAEGKTMEHELEVVEGAKHDSNSLNDIFGLIFSNLGFDRSL